jgi:hypothetical protein
MREMGTLCPPVRSNFFMQGNSRNGVMGLNASVMYLSERLLVKDHSINAL